MTMIKEKAKTKEEKEEIDNKSTNTEQLSGSKNKKGLLSNSSEYDNRNNNGEL